MEDLKRTTHGGEEAERDRVNLGMILKPGAPP
jgi:hypothetical protein